ncbi:hypothetical protein EVAR_995_1 [Eumeta japonica]|uniref:Uncharacterized protein n=1 Tax=Eumeta variegata TaxID=151549 RepID=A0A4C1SE43_EUMVA|nr:hypothetical protein EVAR_995_1 [Eumeta japonica]
MCKSFDNAFSCHISHYHATSFAPMPRRSLERLYARINTGLRAQSGRPPSPRFSLTFPPAQLPRGNVRFFPARHSYLRRARTAPDSRIRRNNDISLRYEGHTNTRVTRVDGHCRPWTLACPECIAGLLRRNRISDVGNTKPVEGECDDEEGLGPPEISLTGRNATAEAVTSRLYFIRVLHLTGRTNPFLCYSKVDHN